MSSAVVDSIGPTRAEVVERGSRRRRRLTAGAFHGWLNDNVVSDVFLVVDAALTKLPPVKEIVDRVRRRASSVRLFSDFPPNPTDHAVARCVEALRDHPTAAIIAVGGGSCIDVAKMARACDVEGASPRDIVLGSIDPNRSGPPLLAIPTTAGTGAETTHFSAVYIDGVKHSLRDPSLKPEFTFLDERFTESLPTSVALQSGLDALCQAIESIWNRRSTLRSMSFAMRALRLAWAALPEVVRGGTPRARRSMLIASHLAGRAIDIARTTACHALSYPLTSRYGIPHGRAVALLLAPVWRFNAAVTADDCLDPRGPAHVRSAMRSICSVLGTADLAEAADVIEDRLRSLGAATSFEEMRVPGTEAIDLIASQIDADRVGNNPRRLGPAEARQILSTLL